MVQKSKILPKERPHFLTLTLNFPVLPQVTPLPFFKKGVIILTV